MDIRVLVATHKKTRMPTRGCYLPIQVGAAYGGDFCDVKDNTGDHISDKNTSFCEMTALYWGWKNLQADAIGLCHYRRYFTRRAIGYVWKILVTEPEVERYLQQVPVILPRKRNYWVETNYSQYIHAHHIQDLTLTRQILQQKYPDYLEPYDRVMKKTTGYRFNMFIMQKPVLEAYCSWLFDILFTLESQLDTTGYSDYDRRVFGFVAERLLDVWIEKNKIAYIELPVRSTENQHWCKKIAAFLLRKITYNKAQKD